MTEYSISYRLWRQIEIRYYRWRSILSGGYPATINIETCTACNRHCYYCANSTIPQKQSVMEQAVFQVVLDRIKEWPCLCRIGLSCINEPLLDPHIDRRVAMLRQSFPWSNIVLPTNGDYLTPDLSGLLVSAGISKIWVTEHPPYTSDWQDRIQYVEGLYPRHILLRGRVEEKDWMHTFQGHGNPKQARSLRRCVYANDFLVIRYDGSVALCCVDVDRDHPQGNILDSSLTDIWRYSKVLGERLSAMDGRPIAEKCRVCLSGKP